MHDALYAADASTPRSTPFTSVKPTSFREVNSDQFCQAKRLRSGTFPCKSADAHRGASGSFMVGVNGPDVEDMRSDRENATTTTTAVLATTPAGRFQRRFWSG